MTKQNHFVQDVTQRSSMKGPLTREEKLEFTATIEADPLHGFILESCSVERQQIIDAIDEVG